MEHLVSKRKLWFTISLILIIPGLISLLLFGLKLGIDFTGGTLWEVKFDQTTTTQQVEDVFREAGYDQVVVQQTGNADAYTFLIRVPEIREGSPEKAVLAEKMTSNLGAYTELEF
ncbi:MAG: protein translocase subunit SecF, partial [Chloroflexia bacterium]|nr:protein translocase subunit SecF [Chloroflexia bacterium]